MIMVGLDLCEVPSPWIIGRGRSRIEGRVKEVEPPPLNSAPRCRPQVCNRGPELRTVQQKQNAPEGVGAPAAAAALSLLSLLLFLFPKPRVSTGFNMMIIHLYYIYLIILSSFHEKKESRTKGLKLLERSPVFH